MRVAIVGLGMAGVRAAVLLERAGVEVSMFDARLRVGGRTFSIDRGGGVAYEAGGEWVDADHHRTRAILAETGQDAVQAENDPELFVWRGERAFADDLWADALRDEERLDLSAREILKNLPNPIGASPSAAALDENTLGNFIARTATSDRGRWWLTSTYRADEGEEPSHVGLLGWLAGYRLYLERDGSELCAFRSPRGFGAVLTAQLAHLRATPQLGWALSGIVREREGVRLRFLLEAGGTEELCFDRVVLAIPPKLVRELDIEPALGAAQTRALQAIGTGRVVKLALEFDDAWWLREGGWRGKMSCDLPIQQTWPLGLGTAPVLGVYACGDDAAWWSQQAEPAERAVEQLASLFPAARRAFVRGWMHDWTTERYTRGGFSHFAPGFVSGHAGGIRAPDDRIHFAGEHTAVWSGFIEGALESAERVADEIVSAR